ncbi:Steroid dehydrogenase [Gryllus bimaculatus]|nr:Steroid dehydrogenase [Gryllus bimaculatus]
MKDLANVLTSDSFYFLWEQIVQDFEHLNVYRNVLAVVGALYITNKTFQFLYSVAHGIATHGLSRYFPVRLTESGDWAVVTGPTEGIGRAFAIELAKRGMSVLLLGRNPDKLQELSDFIRREYKQQTKILVIDFNDPGKAYEDINDAFEKLDIGVVVNNVGTINSFPSFLHEMDDDEIMSMLIVNIQSVTKMTKLAVTHMRKRKKGLIVNVSSIASVAPAPLLQVYAATKVVSVYNYSMGPTCKEILAKLEKFVEADHVIKVDIFTDALDDDGNITHQAYVTSFSQAVNAEVKPDGITVHTLIPSYVKTRMVGYSPYLSTSLLVPTPETYVKNALATLKYSTYSTGYWFHGIQAFFVSSLPVTWYMYMIRRANLIFRNEYLSLHN